MLWCITNMQRCMIQSGLLRMCTQCSQTVRGISVQPNSLTKKCYHRSSGPAKSKVGFSVHQKILSVLSVSCQTRPYSTRRFGDDDADDESDLEEESIHEMFLDENEYGRMRHETIDIHCVGHKVFVVQPVDTMNDKRPTTGELQLEESVVLAKSVADWDVVGSEIFYVSGLSKKRKYLWSKKLMDKLRESLHKAPKTTAIFVSVDYLTKDQLKVLQTEFGLPVLDRNSVVIQIFREHAKTREAKLQVSVAEAAFLRGRLTEVQEGRETTVDLEVLGGKGETFLQARQIILRRRERKLRQELSVLKQQRVKLRESRLKRQTPSVAVIGYTNSGKTTLIKALTGDSKMVPEDKLFATLDVTLHAGYLPNRMMTLFVDTVGFISNIPVALMNAFSATLEDAIVADLVIHVEDFSNPDWPLQRENVLQTVKPMLSDKQFKSLIHVGNKIDKLDTSKLEIESDTLYVSAESGFGLDILREEVQKRLLENTGLLQKKVRIPLIGDHLSYLYKMATVVSTEGDESGENLIVNIVISYENYEIFKHRFGKKTKKVPLY